MNEQCLHLLLHAQAFHGRDKGQNISRQEGQLVSGWIVNTLPTVQDIQDRDRIWEELKKKSASTYTHTCANNTRYETQAWWNSITDINSECGCTGMKEPENAMKIQTKPNNSNVYQTTHSFSQPSV